MTAQTMAEAQAQLDRFTERIAGQTSRLSLPRVSWSPTTPGPPLGLAMPSVTRPIGRLGARGVRRDHHRPALSDKDQPTP